MTPVARRARMFFNSAMDHPAPLPPSDLRRMIMFYCLQGFDLVIPDSMLCDNKNLQALTTLSGGPKEQPQDLDQMLRCGAVRLALRNTQENLLSFHSQRRDQENPPPNLPSDNYVRLLNEACHREWIVSWSLDDVADQFKENLKCSFGAKEIDSRPIVEDDSAEAIRNFISYCEDRDQQVLYADIYQLIENPDGNYPITLGGSQKLSLARNAPHIHERISEAYQYNVPIVLRLIAEFEAKHAPVTFQIGHMSAKQGQELEHWRVQLGRSKPEDYKITTWAFDPDLLLTAPASVLEIIRSPDFQPYQNLLGIIDEWVRLSRTRVTDDIVERLLKLTEDLAGAYGVYAAELEKVYQQEIASPIWKQAQQESRRGKAVVTILTLLNLGTLGIQIVPDYGKPLAQIASLALLAYASTRDWLNFSTDNHLNHQMGKLDHEERLVQHYSSPARDAPSEGRCAWSPMVPSNDTKD